MESAYLNLLQEVLTNGETKSDRTGVGTRSVFGRQLRWHLKDGFPLITTKHVAFKPIVGELLWFIEGSSDERRLCEITYGTRDPEKKTIWSANADYTTGSKYKPQFPGDLGRVYGVQWRGWRSLKGLECNDWVEHVNGSMTYFNAKLHGSKIDQLANIVSTLRTNPNDRRMCLTAFNVAEMDEMSLPPCHMFAQFNVSPAKKELNCYVYIRSNDLFLGLPFNMASYALLTQMMAWVTGYYPGELVIGIGDAHIYLNHIEQVEKQLLRMPYDLPTVTLNHDVREIDNFKMDDVKLHNYRSHEGIKAPMAQ